MQRRSRLTAAFAAAAVLFLAGARHRAVTPPLPSTLDIERSLVINDPAMLDGFDFERVIRTLTDRSGTKTTPLALFQQWFDTQNPKPGLAVANAPHCDDFVTNGKPSFNGFTRRCPTPEGILATSDPFTAHDFIPIGITNRFDLTPADGSNCGQYRIIYAKTTVKPGEKLHIIFEAAMPNPNPTAGLAACRPVAQFWADLSTVNSLAERKARIERFFFDGIDGFEPALRPSHFAPGTGRIRTMQLGGSKRVPRFYQFQLTVSGSRLLAVPALLENYPDAALFNASVNTPSGAEFRQYFLSQIPTLAVRDVNGFGDRIPEKYLIVESDSEDEAESVFSVVAYQHGLFVPEGQTFKDAINAELKRIGSTLTATEVISRAELQNCTGCHAGAMPAGEGIAFPSTFNGTHLDETKETVNGVTRFVISPALRDVFAPNRAKILLDFLAGKPLPVHSNTIGGVSD